HKNGKLELAEKYYKLILKSKPNQPDANHNLGIIFLSNNKIDKALKLLKIALEANPKVEQYWSSYIETLINENYYDIAKENLSIGKKKGLSEKTFFYLSNALKQASASIKPPQSKINNLVSRFQKEKYDEAEILAKSITQNFPEHPLAWKALGGIYLETSKFDQAYDCCNKYILLSPNDPEGYNNLAFVSQKLNNLDQAEVNYKKALGLRPNYFLALFSLGDVYKDLGKFDEAEKIYRKTISLNPKHAEVYNSLGYVQRKLGSFKDAEMSYKQAIRLKPDFFIAYNNLANSLFHLRKWKEAIESYKKAISLKPDYAEAHSNKNYMLLFLNGLSENEIFDEHREFERQFSELKLNKFGNFPIEDNPYKKLKIGYVSPDFRSHSVAHFFEPLLQNHNPDTVETYCYYNNKIVDKITQRLMNFSNHWRSIYGLSDKKAVIMIKNDEIDILVDLAGHTGKNRLLIFAHKAAPIQITYLGYPGTTGLSAIDYRFTDIIADPVGITDKYHSEKLIRLPNGFLCYKGDQKVNFNPSLPFNKNRRVTFGSFNNLNKITPEVITLWSKILHAIPQSNLILKSGSIDNNLQVCVDLFKKEKIDEKRIKIIGRIDNIHDHLKLYDMIDIGLDPFPYNGATTTCEALWMGVPVITLLGNSHVSRVSASILNRINLTSFIANNKKEYKNLAIKISKDIKYLENIRQNLRSRMLNSNLTNGLSFARDVEKSYQKIWSKYVDQ
ncbi:tetratricopeptide repeat protein, partial [Alphaproteobacteria bacterium]|nr:tetratricopeptide repeat protein [Alphaproteobacteria bacterium]